MASPARALPGDRRGLTRRLRPRGGAERRSPVVFVPAGVAGEALILAGLAMGQALVVLALGLGWWLVALVLHLGCCLALLLRPAPPPDAEPWATAVLRLLTATLPALGPLAIPGALAALALGVPRRLRRVAPPLPEDPVDARLDAIALARDVPDGLLLESLGDVLRWGHARQKARALDLAAEPARPGGVALLRLALSDADPAVRARTELLRPQVERRLLEAAEALRAVARGQSGANGRAAQRALARALDRAAFSGLLEPPRADACRAEAAGLWQALAEAAPDGGPEGGDAEAEAALGRNLLALGDLPAARRALEAAVTRGAAGGSAIGWLAECLFRARDFAALEALVLRWRPLLEAEARRAAVTGPHAAAWRLWLAEAPR
ncbi:hypothetical protein HB662_04205 [Roseomonas frigidaquae]|uniref:Uncharacterized protein n=1 Tax=Falsiroseomonas frigidaquae TaxID=487318 RepID=A0ABX1ETR1_9PROT|nr:hypothetical protein [Falsiroseomonas frigidaquae]NKE43967.1 hypothetical protein [Falsiroseomonas frigidaquae]